MAKNKVLDKHHLFLHGKYWWIRFTYPAELGGQRVRFPTGTSDIAIAVNIRDRILNPILGEKLVADVGRKLIASIKQADETGRTMVAMANEELNRSTPIGPKLHEVGAKFLVNRRDFKGRSGHTLDDYQRTLIAFEKVISNLHVEAIEPKHVRQFREQLLLVGVRWLRGNEPDLSTAPMEERLTARTVVKMIKNLITFFNWALK